MYEPYYGFAVKPFSLTPDPKYLYRSESHANAFELLQYAIDRREGFVVITGDIGTGKTTVCRALLEQTGKKTLTALVLNPFLSEADLLRVILQDLGVINRGEERAGGRQPSKQDLINTLNDFLLSLIPLGAHAVLIVDEAQNLPLSILEQIRILSNLETDKEKLFRLQPNEWSPLLTPPNGDLSFFLPLLTKRNVSPKGGRVRESYVPGPAEFLSGAIKSNDVSLLQTFQRAFQL